MMMLQRTSIICTMFENGLMKLIPVQDLESALEYKKNGFIVAAEREGEKVDFADFGNSPFEFTFDKINNETLVYSTTNGTNAINLSKEADMLILGSFLNITELAKYIVGVDKDVLILCAGWKGDYCFGGNLGSDYWLLSYGSYCWFAQISRQSL